MNLFKIFGGVGGPPGGSPGARGARKFKILAPKPKKLATNCTCFGTCQFLKKKTDFSKFSKGVGGRPGGAQNCQKSENYEFS